MKDPRTYWVIRWGQNYLRDPETGGYTSECWERMRFESKALALSEVWKLREYWPEKKATVLRVRAK